MNKDIERALNLRKDNQLKESNQLLLELCKVTPYDSFLNYQVAWSFDILGEEDKAILFYEKAIELGLNEEYLEDAYLGMGSTYRTLGDYNKSKVVFEKAIHQFPQNNALKVFYAMTLFNLGRHDISMEILLQVLSATSNDTDIQNFKKAILFYSDKLDKIW
ncbi:tetratricopeptide repeat protein [Liquorilactobacillus mali]|uniref:tetratricopeptide repeat protein n=1 Tax=Liquorilactobacillus mali TaxID=1618 RepID=UPI0026524206|nr:tetratricopeptide repeat protein [Liquorilactobacillus mali]MDN7145886.1 tetratricopeptide repeat protein [Liquorilactobacillus mali]